MSDTPTPPPADRPDRVTALLARVADLEQAKVELVQRLDAELECVREDLADLQRSRDEQSATLRAVSTELGTLRADVGALRGGLTRVTEQLGAISATLATSPRRAAVAAGAGAGVPAGLVLVLELLRALGVLHG